MMQMASPIVIAEGIRGNDLVVRHDGSIYVTNPGGDWAGSEHIWYISPKGEKKVVDKGLKFANGVTLSPDQSLLYVADSRTHWVYSYQIQPDGSLAHKQKYFHLHVPDTADDSGAERHPGRPRRPALRGDAHGYAGVRSGGPGQLHHSDAERQGRQPLLRRREVRYALRHLRRQGLHAQGEGPGCQRLPGPREAPRPGSDGWHAQGKNCSERLETKGYVSRDRRERAHRFQVRVSREEFLRHRLQGLADRLCDGAIVPLVTSLLRSKKGLSRKHGEQLRKLIDELWPADQ